MDTKSSGLTSAWLSRRTVVAGATSLLVARPAVAADNVSPIAHGVLANNPLALAFEAAPSELPDVAVEGLKGTLNTAQLKGRTILMPLWAEWCAPCLGEIPDFARLQQKYGSAKFAIMPVLTGTRKMLTPTLVAQIFSFLHAEIFDPLIEVHLGDKLMSAMAKTSSHKMEIPCNLLIAPDGHVVGREFGLKSDEDTGPKAGLVARAEAGETLSLWGKEAGEEFAAAMANGFLG